SSVQVAVAQNVVTAYNGQSSVTLSFSTSGSPLLIYWYRGVTTEQQNLIVTWVPSSYSWTNGPQYTGRESAYSTGYLTIRNVVSSDAGHYKLKVKFSDGSTHTTMFELQVKKELQEASAGVNDSNPLEGGSVTMTFNVQGTPDTILWYKDQKPLLISTDTRSVRAENRIRLSSDNKTLTISSVSRTDSGIYQGEASNPFSTSRSEELKIDISYGPDTPIITLESNPVLVGSKVTLNCTAASSPAPNYEWNFNDNKKSTGQFLTIPVVSISDAGTYTCLAFNNRTNLRSRKHLELKVTEELREASAGVNVSNPLEGGSVTMTFNVQGTPDTILWYKDQKLLVISTDTRSVRAENRIRLSSDNKTLTISSVSRTDSDAGTYTCLAFNTKTNLRSRKHLELQDSSPTADSTLPIGQIVGIVVGSVLGVGGVVTLLVVGVVLCRKRNSPGVS
uniref:Ig-like domain-containing protein n=1 Tax=Latimeria chalumnae TaxID=7897 RepID=H2ZT06_LATCH